MESQLRQHNVASGWVVCVQARPGLPWNVNSATGPALATQRCLAAQKACTNAWIVLRMQSRPTRDADRS